jgi:hypothetical protein
MQYRLDGAWGPAPGEGRRTKDRQGFKAWAGPFITWLSFSLMGVLIARMTAHVVAYLN